jgi:Family of unknown function (DUF6455)
MTQGSDSTVLTRALDWMRARVSRDNELATLADADMHYLAMDIGITEAEFRALAPQIADHSIQLDQMMLARGIDPTKVRKAFSALTRDMEVSCALCPTPSLCRSRLQNGSAASTMHEFCPNAALIDSIPSAST